MIKIKTVLITGGSSGIGRSCVFHFSRLGYKVFFTYKSHEKEAIEISGSTGSSSFYCDISSANSVNELYKKTGDIDILINNAAIAEQKLFVDITNDDWDKMLGTNLTGMFYVTKQYIGNMINKKSGSIVNVSSIWGVRGGSCEVHYSASKGGVISFTKALAREMGPSGIRVNCVAPGVVDTKMNSNLDKSAMDELLECTPLCRIGTPEEIAEAIYFLATGANFVTGQVLEVDGGIIL